MAEGLGDDPQAVGSWIAQRPLDCAMGGIGIIGPGDLGLSLGHGVGQNRTEPAMVEAFAAIRSAAAQFDRRCGIFATTADYARQTAAEGFDIVVPWVDAPAIAASLAAASMP